MGSDLKSWVHRIYKEIMSEGNLDLIDELLHDDFVEHEDFGPDMPAGKDGPRAMLGMLRSAFPDVVMTVEDIVEEGGTVAVRGRMRGTHTGEFMGIPATGKPVDVAIFDFIRFEDGRAKEHWGVMEDMKLMQQLGLMPDAPG